MNPLTNVKNITKLNELELARGTKKSWHDVYKNSAWIFIGGLPYDLTEGDILAVFSQYGEIVNVNLVRDKKTGKTKGFGFLCYANQKSTILAVDNFNGMKLCNRTIRVDHVENYKPPKEDDRDDEITKMLKSEGCAPKSIKAEPRSPSREKKKKKKSKKEKKKHKKDNDDDFQDVKIKEEKEKPGYDKYEYPEKEKDVSASQKYDSSGTRDKIVYKQSSDYKSGSAKKKDFNIFERGESSKMSFEDRDRHRENSRDKYQANSTVLKYSNHSPERKKRKDHYVSSPDCSDSEGAKRRKVRITRDKRIEDTNSYKNNYKDDNNMDYKNKHEKKSSVDSRDSHRSKKHSKYESDVEKRLKESEKHLNYDSSSSSDEQRHSKRDRKQKSHKHHKDISSSDNDSRKLIEKHRSHSRESSRR